MRRVLSTALVYVLLLSSMAGLTGCDKRAEGEALAKTGATTAETLANYYDSLIKDTLDTWEFEAFNVAVRNALPAAVAGPCPNATPAPGSAVTVPEEPAGADDAADETVTFNAAQQRRLQSRIDALSQRARLARRLLSTYNALKELSAYDASGAVKESAENLTGAITGLTKLDGGIDPSTIFGMVAADIAAWKQSRDIRKGSRLILRTIDGLSKLFEAESQVYKTIPRERSRKAMLVARYLIRNKHALALPLLQKVPEELGIRLAGADKAVECGATMDGLVEIVRVRMARTGTLSAGAADNIKTAIEGLAENHHKLQAKSGLSLDRVLASLARAQAYVDEIEKLREAAKKAD